MEQNKRIWDKLKSPPPSALKKITGGRLKGKSDISPQWRYEIMTEVFGACGTGWIFNVERLWTEPGADGEVFAFAQVDVKYKDGEEWSNPVQGIGGSMLVEKESKGLHSNDEAFKMAVTDAVGTALKMIGVAADVYAGKCDGKYPTSGPKAEDALPDSLKKPAKIKSKPSVKKKFDALMKMKEEQVSVVAEVMLKTAHLQPKDLNAKDFKWQRAIDIFAKFGRWPDDTAEVVLCVEFLTAMYGGKK